MEGSNTSYQKVGKVFQKKQLIFLVIGIVALIMFITFSDFKSVLEYISISDKGFYTLAFLSMILGVFAYGGSWISLLKSANIRLNNLKAMESVWISVFLNIMVPTASVGGEVARVLYVVEETKDSYGHVAATVFLHRVISFLPFIVGSISGFLYLIIFFDLPTYLSSTLVIVSLALCMSLIILLLFSVRPKISMGIALRISHFLDRIFSKRKGNSSKLTELTTRAFTEFDVSLKMLKSSKVSLALSTLFAFAYWIFDIIVAYLVFASLKFPVPLGVIIAVYTIGISIQIVPIGIPGMVGIVETVMSGLYVVSGIPLSLSVAATVMIRLIMMWFEASIGGVIFLLYSRR
jgi:uncharacterized protein (TIRG00374 family)